LSLFLLPWVQGLKNIRRKAGELGRGVPFDQPTQLIAAYIAVLPSIFVFNFLAGIFYNLQLMTIFAICMGLVYNSLREKPDLINDSAVKS
jgi:hypothetical protein